MKQCVAMAQELTRKVPVCDLLPQNFFNFEERSQFDINMAIESMTIHKVALLAVA